MKLPVGNETSIVFTSDPKEFRAAHKGDAKVTSGYVDTLKAQGWEMAKFDTSKEDSALATGEFTKGIDRLTMRAYMFDGSTTAVVLELNPQP